MFSLLYTDFRLSVIPTSGSNFEFGHESGISTTWCGMDLANEKEQTAFAQILNEFATLTNEQAYVNIFAQRMMQPVPGSNSEFYGCDQRLAMLPYLQKLVSDLAEQAEIFDVGAGAGDVVDYALKDVPAGTTIHIEEPNQYLIKTYQNKLRIYGLNQGIAYAGPLQDYYSNVPQTTPPQKPQNLILAIHMIYHLTDFTMPMVHPEKDLLNALTFLYGLLAPKGKIFIVYADLMATKNELAACSLAEKYFRSAYPNNNYADNLNAIYEARNALLGPQGSIAKLLSERFPNTPASFYAQRQQTHFFGQSIADIAVLALAGELCPNNDIQFQLEKLKFCYQYIVHHPESIGLQKEDRNVPQKGLWRANEPQVVAIISK